MHVLVNLNHRSKAATTETTNRFEGKTPVIRGFSFFYVQGSLNSFANFFTPSNMAGRTQTNRNNVSASWLKTKRAVKSCHSINMA